MMCDKVHVSFYAQLSMNCLNILLHSSFKEILSNLKKRAFQRIVKDAPPNDPLFVFFLQTL